MSETLSIKITPARVVAVLSTAYFLHLFWNQIPPWIKKPFLRSLKKDTDQSNDTNSGNLKKKDDHFASPNFIISKLQDIMSVTDSIWEEAAPREDIPQHKINFAILHILRMMEMMKKHHANFRDELYSKGGHELTETELRDMAEVLEFSDLAYEESFSTLRIKMREMGFTLLRHDLDTEPGRIGHFIAIHHERKVALFGLKGTSSLSDVLTDLLFQPFVCTLDSPFIEGDKTAKSREIRCHEGILQAAKTMLDESQNLIEHLFLPSRYKILLCGHSLGAGAACLLGLLLRSKIPALRKDNNTLRVIAIAPPAVLNFEASRACAGFTTSIVNNSDIVPRISLPNIKLLAMLTFKILDKIETTDNQPKTFEDFKKFILLEGDLILTPEELYNFYEETYRSDDINTEEKLFVPGRVVVLWKKGKRANVAEGNKDETDDNCDIGAVVTDCGMRMLRHIEMTSTLIDDHMANAYRENIAALLKQILVAKGEKDTKRSSIAEAIYKMFGKN